MWPVTKLLSIREFGQHDNAPGLKCSLIRKLDDIKHETAIK